MTAEQLDKYYSDKAPVPHSPETLYELMQHGGGLDREFNNPLYREKMEGIELEVIRSWVEELCGQERSQKSTVLVKMILTENGSTRSWQKYTGHWLA